MSVYATLKMRNRKAQAKGESPLLMSTTQQGYTVRWNVRGLLVGVLGR